MQLAGFSVKRELAPVAVVVGLVAVSFQRDVLDTDGVERAKPDEVQRELLNGAAVRALCRARAGRLELNPRPQVMQTAQRFSSIVCSR